VDFGCQSTSFLARSRRPFHGFAPSQCSRDRLQCVNATVMVPNFNSIEQDVRGSAGTGRIPCAENECTFARSGPQRHRNVICRAMRPLSLLIGPRWLGFCACNLRRREPKYSLAGNPVSCISAQHFRVRHWAACKKASNRQFSASRAADKRNIKLYTSLLRRHHVLRRARTLGSLFSFHSGTGQAVTGWMSFQEDGRPIVLPIRGARRFALPTLAKVLPQEFLPLILQH